MIDQETDPATGSPSPLPWYARPAARAWTCAAPPPDARRFHAALPGYAPTALHELPALARELAVARVFVKDESARLGLPAFKALGASWAIDRILAPRANDGTARSVDDRPVRLVTATDGNHGRAVARLARQLGRRAHVFVPDGVHPAAVAAIRGEGAEVTAVPGSYDAAVSGARAAAAVTDAATATAVRDLAESGVAAGPCGAAALAGLRAALTGAGRAERRAVLGLDAHATLVLISTEGTDANPGSTERTARQ